MDTVAMAAKMIENLKINTGKSLEQWIIIKMNNFKLYCILELNNLTRKFLMFTDFKN